MTDRRAAQLRNDLDDLYEIVGGIATTVGEHTQALGDIRTTVDEHTRTLSDIQATIGEHTPTLGGHGEKLDEILSILRRS